MKKIISFIIVVFIATVNISAQWTTSAGTFSTTNNVGIGTSAPSTNLQVIGNANIGRNSNVAFPVKLDITSGASNQDARIDFGYYTTFDATAYVIGRWGVDASFRICDYPTGTELTRFIISGSGNVGMGGITAPTAVLHLKGSGSTNATTSLLIQNSAGTEALRVLDNGNVSITGALGIGLQNPMAKLHLMGNQTPAGAPVIMVQNMISTGLVGSLRFASGYNAGDSWSGIEGYGTGGADQQDLRFYTTYGARNERMRILQTGEVGIGTTTGSARLNIKGFGATPATASLIIQNSTGTESFRVLDNGSVGIGTSSPGSFKLAVEGKIGARGVKVTMQTPWPDYVFENNYRILPIAELEKFIKKEKHLPEVSSASAIEKDGIDLGDFQTVLLKKVEELTLYLIDQNKKLESQGNEINSLKKQLLLLQTK